MAAPKDLVITFLGSGSAFCLAEENYNSNILINVKGEGFKKKYLLFDAGHTVIEALHTQRISLASIHSIFISHQHADHIGGLENIAFKRYFGKYPFGQNKPHIVGNADILKNTWNDSLKGGLQTIQGEVNSLESYFECTYLEDNGSFEFYGVNIEPFKTLHSIDNNRIVPSYGIIINGDKKVLISGDTQLSVMIPYYYKVDYIFQDCEFANYINGIHAQFHELCTLPDEVKAKMWLYHYTLKIGEKEAEDGYKENIYESFEDREKTVLEAGFAGLVKRGQVFHF